MDWFPPIYVMCNPHYEPERFKFLVRHFEERGIPSNKIQYVFGPWGTEITSEMLTTLTIPYKPKFGLEKILTFKAHCLSKGELSLCITFHKIIEACVKGDYDKILVFESDVVLRSDFVQRLKEVLELSPANWDYISLSEGVGTRPPGHPLTYFCETSLHTPPYQWVFRCCDSMLLRKKFMEKLLYTFFPIRECLDWEMNLQMLAHKGISYWADPPLVEAGTNRNRVLTNLPA
jgi:GR25 family glycosyltransferase involved in LPS biosynthesis